jgi:ZIP family zinc transporter
MNFLIISAIAIFLSTFFGGLFALKFKDKLHLILGFSAGSVIGVAFFDLLPEAFSMGSNIFTPSKIALFIAIGFVTYILIDRILSPYSHNDEICDNQNHKGTVGAGSMSVHSLLDGLTTGLAYHVSPAIGILLASAVIMHDFSDGINTVNMILRSGGDTKKARLWLFADALAPTIGIILSVFIMIPEKIFSILLAVFCGFFLYIGASDLLPESHHGHPKIWTTISTILGITLIFIVTKFAGV